MKRLPGFFILCFTISAFFSSCEKEPLPELMEESVYQTNIFMDDSGEEDVPIDDKKDEELIDQTGMSDSGEEDVPIDDKKE